MRLHIAFVRRADVVVAVEGWMMHAAYCLGKRYRLLMLPYSHPFDWHPYGRALNQDVALDLAHAGHAPAEDRGAPPLPGRSHKAALRCALEALEASGQERARSALRWALVSEDRDERLSAARAPGRFPAAIRAPGFLGLLDDPVHGVRGVAAEALLAEGAASVAGVAREALVAHTLIARPDRDWVAIAQLGSAALPAIRRATQDDNPVVRREAALLLPLLEEVLTPAAGAPGRGAARHATGRDGPGGGILRRWLGRLRPAPRWRGAGRPTILVLTPLKDAEPFIDNYCQRLLALSYPHRQISVGFLESDSQDATCAASRPGFPGCARPFAGRSCGSETSATRSRQASIAARRRSRSSAGGCWPGAATTCCSTPWTTRTGCCGWTST